LGTPTGTVAFMNGTGTLGTTTLNSSGVAIFSTSTLTVGTYEIIAVYRGDANFKTSTSATLTQTISQDNSTTLVFNSVNPSVFGQEVVFNSFVLPATPGRGTPTGTVTFRDGATTLGSVSLTNGHASLIRFGLSVGTHLISVIYAGDANFNTSTSGTMTQTVKQASTITAVATSVNPSTAGQAVIFTATVNPLPQGSGTPTGTVTIDDNGVSIGTATLHANANGTGSTATLTISTLTAGKHPITVVYAGDANFVSSTSVTLTQTVNAAAVRLTALSGFSRPTGPEIGSTSGNPQVSLLPGLVAPGAFGYDLQGSRSFIEDAEKISRSSLASNRPRPECCRGFGP
jgi:hypothetical protein